MFTFWMGFIFGFLTITLIATVIYQFHEMNLHPERFHDVIKHE